MTKTTLASLFDSQKDVLAEQLKGLFLPKDATAIQTAVGNYLNKLFDEDGEFRQNLTQSEDYILKAALSLLNAQQEIGSAIQISIPVIDAKKAESHTEKPQFQTQNPFLSKTNPVTAIIGTTGGAIIGHAFGGGWATVFGAIAGTAITIYMSNMADTKHQTSQTISLATKKEQEKDINTPIDVSQFIEITHRICESVDNLIATFRAQIKRVIDKYENQEKPTLEKDYITLLEGIQSLIGYERAHSEDEKFILKIKERIEDLADLLDNYNISVEDYAETNKEHFMFVPTPNNTADKQVYPAITKNGLVILKGKVFTPDNK